MARRIVFACLLPAFCPFAWLYAQGVPTGIVGWYNGDWQPGIPGQYNWYVSQTQFSRTYDDFVVPEPGWIIAGAFSHNTRYSSGSYGDPALVKAATEASWEIRSGVSSNSPGVVLASGRGPATETLRLIPGSGLNLCRIQVDGLSVQLAPGRYWLSVTPVVGPNESFQGLTLGAGAVGAPTGKDGMAYSSSGASFTAIRASGAGGASSDLSMGVLISRQTPTEPIPVPAPLSLSELWRADLSSLVDQMLSLHSTPFPAPGISVADFQANAADLYTRIPTLSDAEIRTGIQALVASIEDPHTDVGWGAPSPFRFLPLSFYWFDDGMHVTAAPALYRDLLGGRVVAVGQRNMDDVIQRLTPLVAHENDQWLKYVIPQNKLGNTDFLFGTGITADTDGAHVVVETASGDFASADVKAESAGAMLQAFQGNLPLYRQHADLHYWATIIDGGATVYFQYNNCTEDPRQASADFIPQLNRLLEQDGVERVIVDLRNNTGGSTSILNPWIASIRNSRFNMRGRLYVITGRATFSAAMATTDEFRDQTAAIFVGEPTGAKPQFQIRISAFNLPYFGITASYSRGAWQTPDPGPTLIPDIQTPVTFQDYMSGVDPALDAILSVPAPT
jgi:hypothetical protein